MYNIIIQHRRKERDTEGGGGGEREIKNPPKTLNVYKTNFIDADYSYIAAGFRSRIRSDLVFLLESGSGSCFHFFLDLNPGPISVPRS